MLPDRDAVARALSAVEKFAEVMRPEDIDEPILAPSVAHAVHEWLVEINNAAELAAVGIQPRRLALLYGPPGTGKTTLAHHLSARLGLPLVAVQSSCVLLLDEFDALAQKRLNARQGAEQERNQSLAVLLRRIEAFRGVGMAATNMKDSLDAAMWRRFGLQISVDLPGDVERFAILRKYAAPFDLSDEALDVLVDATRGCSPSLLRQLMEGMKRALVLAHRLHVDVSRPAEVFARIVASIAPPPEMEQPPLWARTAAVDALAGIAWPPERAA
jgi:SpoVK/Ycf46/Vps4 family AAA+-type ATPase